MSTGAGIARRAGMVTVVGLASAGAVFALAKLLQLDVEAAAADEYLDDEW